MTGTFQRLMAMLAALALAVTLVQPAVLAQDDDDDDWDDDDAFEVDDDDDEDDDVWYIEDDDDDDVPAPTRSTEWDDDLVGYGDEDDDLPIASRAIVQLAPGIDPYAFAGRYGVDVLRIIPGPNIVLLGIGDITPGSATEAFDSGAPLNDDDDDDDRFEIDDDFYGRYNVRDDRRADMNALLVDPDVLWAEFNFTGRAPEGRPRYFFASMDGVPQVVDAPALPQGLELDPAAVCASGDAVIVAVLDTGVDVTHPALSANILPGGVNMLQVTRDVSDAGNGIDDDGDGQVDEMVGHGTHVTGTILQVAPDAQILPVKVLDSDGSGDTFSIAAGIVYAVEQGADVINLSLGSTWQSAAIDWAVEMAESEGVIVVAAAGNGNRAAPVEYPASSNGVISVAATDAAGDKAEYSNYNESVDISAPGNDVASAYPGGTYTTASGTSMSAPIVAGTVALMLERAPDMAPATATSRIANTAGPLSLSDPSLEFQMGGGEIDVNATLVCGG